MQVTDQVKSQVEISDNETRNVYIPGLDQVALVISFILNETAPNDIVNVVENALPQFDADPSFGVLAFQPSGKIMFQLYINHSIHINVYVFMYLHRVLLLI